MLNVFVSNKIREPKQDSQNQLRSCMPQDSQNQLRSPMPEEGQP